MIKLLAPVSPVYRHLAIVGLVLAAMGWAYLKGAEHEEYENAVRLNKQVAASAEQTATWQRRKDDALHAKAKRDEANNAAANSARADAEGLRKQLADIRRAVPDITRDAVNDYAATLADVFGECTSRYTELAATTDANASDRQTLIDAWPK